MSIRAALVCVVGFMLCVQIWATPISRLFIEDADTVRYCAAFLRIHSSSMPFMVVTLLMVSALQSTGLTRQAFGLSIIRKGIFDIPLMIFMNHLFRMYGVIACQPIMDVISATVAVVLYVRFRKQVEGREALALRKQKQGEAYDQTD